MREARGLTLRELAEQAQVDAGYLSKVERNLRQPSEHWLGSIVKAFGNELRRVS